ncbi:hypothetical protein ACO1O0_000451 [Amphichorda felina]
MRCTPSSWRSQPLESLVLALLSAAHLTSASPYPRDDLHDLGYSGRSVCTTIDGDIATCVAPHGGGEWGAITTTWTETRTYTSTIMTHWEPAPEPTEGVDCVPQNDQQEACGAICCAGWQTCAFDGQCSLKPGYQEPSTIVITTGGKTTTQYSAPYRVTGTTTLVTTGPITQTQVPTGTQTAPNPTGTTDGATGAGGSGGGGLSGGEIAGIVIGSIAGAVLLLLIAFCCIARGLWGLCFGRKKREHVDVYEERYSRHGSRDRHSGWFGGGGGGGGGHSEKKSSGKKWLGLAGLAATLLALLNLRKSDKKPARKPTGSRYSNSYYSYSDATSPSTSSSGRRTYRTRRTGDSRGPPRSQYSKSSRSRRS